MRDLTYTRLLLYVVGNALASEILITTLKGKIALWLLDIFPC